jgi:hypothetical protein
MCQTITRLAGVEVLDLLRERGYTPDDGLRGALGTSQQMFDLYADGIAVTAVVEEGELTEVHVTARDAGNLYSVRLRGASRRMAEAVLDAAEAEDLSS